tara:strand:+ start:904 stop:1206 length:303 start_codon:yes stop_codon:yes gene_type:complete
MFFGYLVLVLFIITLVIWDIKSQKKKKEFDLRDYQAKKGSIWENLLYFLFRGYDDPPSNPSNKDHYIDYYKNIEYNNKVLKSVRRNKKKKAKRFNEKKMK